MSEDRDAPRRIVIRMPNWLGDAVMALPAVAAVRAAFPAASLTLAAIPSIAPMLEENTGAGQQEVISVDKSTETQLLRSGGFDTALLLPNSFRSAWSARQSGIPHRWGYRAGVRGPLLTRAVKRPEEGGSPGDLLRRSRARPRNRGARRASEHHPDRSHAPARRASSRLASCWLSGRRLG